MQYAPPPPVAGFYNPAVVPYPPGPADSRMPRGMSMMAMPQPSIPSALQPGAGPRSSTYVSHRNNSGDLSGDLFFSDAPRMPMPQVSSAPPQMRHTVSAPPPPLPRKPSFDAPPLPPKPSKTSPPGALPLYPPVSHNTNSFSEPSTSLAQTPVDIVPGRSDTVRPPSEEVDPALRAALEQSRRDEEAAKRREEEELAKAMAESLSVSQRREPAQVTPVASGSRSSYYDRGSSSGATASFGSPYPSPALMSTNPFVQSPDSGSLSVPAASPGLLTSSPPGTTQQILDDETLARQIAEEEEQLARQKVDEERAKALANAQAAEQARRVAADLTLPSRPPPEYPAADPPPPATPESLQLPVSEPTTSGTPSPVRSTVPSPDIHRHRSSSAVPTTAPLYDENVRAGRSQSFGAYGTSPAASRPSLPHSPTSNGMRSAAASPKLPSVPEKAASVSSHTSGETSNYARTNESPGVSSRTNDVSPRPTSQYVDTELLRGVSIGFNPPAITSMLVPMEGPIPNVIALPYGRAPPLHIKAPNWRDMLTLMARLSNTRLEPTVEAMAVVKTPMHLRVVVNFVKVHASSNDWHVVLYMTIDYPIPEGHRYKTRNPNDPALLPYSYTLSSTPAFLRENADSPLSKWYCIPATPQNPYPTLPISFPDLATYLMTALEDSRRAAHDRSSGWHRLAKAIDQIYPSPAGDDDPEERSRFSRVRGFFGRGSKQNRPANDDRSTLVTPFYADEYGR